MEIRSKYARKASHAERFDAKHEPEPNSGCWLWVGGVDKDGYGVFSIRKKNMRAHRFSWQIENGPIAPMLTIDHLCRVRSCVNPAHLRAVTNAENLKAKGSLAPAAINAAKLTCPSGHVYDEANTRAYRGRRDCRACDMYRMRAKRAS